MKATGSSTANRKASPRMSAYQREAERAAAQYYDEHPTPKDHGNCRTWLKGLFAATGIDVTVSRQPPIKPNPYNAEPPFVCPHGTTFYSEPTSEQIATWIRDKVE